MHSNFIITYTILNILAVSILKKMVFTLKKELSLPERNKKSIIFEYILSIKPLN